jgi:YYY domain-containing protein
MTFFEAAGAVIAWWAVSLIMAVAVWPVVYLCLKRLPDRGLAFARIFGLLIIGYIFWVGCWLRLWANVSGAIWLCVLIVGAAAAAFARSKKEDPWGWLWEHRREALAVEGVYLALFAALAWILAYTPGANHTEAPMDLAFVNAILHSAYFPPTDPWLSGYAISYYHFGYILTAMQARAAALPGGVAFTLSLASCFALACTAAYGLLRNVLILRFPAPENPIRGGMENDARKLSAGPPRARAPRFLALSLLAPMTLFFVGNLQGFLDILYYQRVGWEDGQGYFWKWLDLESNGSDRITPPVGSTNILDHTGWWWQSSRVINDRDLAGNHVEVIDEFPAFSFIIGDMHPHMLALPFLIAALGVILELLLRGGGAVPEASGERWLFIFFTALSIGSLVFLNTWDVLVFGLAAIAGRVGWMLSGRSFQFGRFAEWGIGLARWILKMIFRLTGWRVSGRPEQFSRFGEWCAFLARWGVTAGIAVLLFVPFFIGFSSQAGGILPNVIFPTKSQQFLIMFGVLLLPILFWIVLDASRQKTRLEWWNSLALVGIGILVLLVGSIIAGFIVTLQPAIDLSGLLGGLPPMDALSIVLWRRISDPLPWLLPSILILIALAILLGWMRTRMTEHADRPAAFETPDIGRLATAFILLLVFWGAILVVFPEFFYLRDFFGDRMNTVFKFYFQGWADWSLAAAFGFAVLLRMAFDRMEENARRWSFAVIGVFFSGMLFILGALFLPMGIWDRTGGFQPFSGPTLDAAAFLEWKQPGDAAAIAWMRENIHNDGPVAEAIGGDFLAEFARVATNTGIPNVIGWIGHEDQWRGGRREMGVRDQDIRELFQTTSWESAEEILSRYGIRYVFYGSVENQTYRSLGIKKFLAHLPVIYQNESVIIFERVEP